MGKWSINKKLNTCLQAIEDSLLEMCETPEESLSDIKRYMNEFPKGPDYNIAQCGNLPVCYDEIREFYKSCGYSAKGVARRSNDDLWATYKHQVGYVANCLIKNQINYGSRTV